MIKLLIYCLLLIILLACNSDTKETVKQSSSDYIKELIANTQAELATPNNQVVDHYQVLLMGNSHINGLEKMLKKLIFARFPTKQVTSSSTQDLYYLSDRIKDKASIDKLINTPWTHVILQAQKYSSSGAYSYPTDAAISWIKLAKNQYATPIMFPEHPRLGNTTEGLRVYQLHKRIAEEESSCVAPIGLAWDRVIEHYPEISLYYEDGNHANITGSLLTAFVLYQVITGESADELPYIAAIEVAELTQDLLRQIATYTLEQNPACNF